MKRPHAKWSRERLEREYEFLNEAYHRLAKEATALARQEYKRKQLTRWFENLIIA